jgi:hypothetical protein
MNIENPAPPLSLEEQRMNDKDRRFGRDIAYGIQQTIACWVTDFIDPPVSKFLQNTFGNKKHKVTDTHTFGGEFIGDSAALGIFLVAKRFFGGAIDGVISGVKSATNPWLTRMGKGAIKPWAEAHGVREGDDRYTKKLEEYKDFQAENIVDSAIISTAATGVNVVAQRQLGNKQAYTTILGSKMVGATLTLGLMGGLRMIFPTSTKALDDEISDRYSSKLVKFTKKMLGVKEAAADASNPPTTATHPTAMPATITPEKREGLMAILVEDAVKIDFRDPKAFQALVDQQTAFYQAFLATLDTDGYLIDVMAREHFEVIEKNYKGCFDHADLAARERDKEASRQSVIQATAQKREELKQFIAMLSDPAFQEEAKTLAAKGHQPAIRPHAVTKEETSALANTLLSESQGQKDPVSAIFDTAEKRALNYQALAHANEPEGIVTRIMASTMRKLLPDRDPQAVDKVSKDYMQYYNQEALAMAKALKPDAPAVQDAVTRAKALRQGLSAPQPTTLAM